jgi:hypothetical protein
VRLIRKTRLLSQCSEEVIPFILNVNHAGCGSGGYPSNYSEGHTSEYSSHSPYSSSSESNFPNSGGSSYSSPTKKSGSIWDNSDERNPLWSSSPSYRNWWNPLWQSSISSSSQQPKSLDTSPVTIPIVPEIVHRHFRRKSGGRGGSGRGGSRFRGGGGGGRTRGESGRVSGKVSGSKSRGFILLYG